VREDRVLAHFPALLIRLRSSDHENHPLLPDARALPTPAEALDHTREHGVGLTYDAADKTLTADTERAERILIR
jgi:hypothetical protein